MNWHLLHSLVGRKELLLIGCFSNSLGQVNGRNYPKAFSYVEFALVFMSLLKLIFVEAPRCHDKDMEEDTSTGSRTGFPGHHSQHPQTTMIRRHGFLISFVLPIPFRPSCPPSNNSVISLSSNHRITGIFIDNLRTDWLPGKHSHFGVNSISELPTENTKKDKPVRTLGYVILFIFCLKEYSWIFVF